MVLLPLDRRRESRMRRGRREGERNWNRSSGRSERKEQGEGEGGMTGMEWNVQDAVSSQKP